MTLLTQTRKRDWETTFTSWAQPPGATEQERCERAVNAISRAISRSVQLNWRNVRTFAQGSYANRTNVRQDSDVDVCALCSDTFFFDLPAGVSAGDASITLATYTFAQYKDDVESALVEHFGRANVRRGNKAFDINENTYRVDADVAPCFEYRLYYGGGYGGLSYHSGTALICDRDGRRITNFPQQQYDNGVVKNEATGRRFKKAVRIVKCLRNEMHDEGWAAAGLMASFLIESLVWNAPNHLFYGASSYRDMIQGILAYLLNNTQADEQCSSWTEVNGIKKLFHYTQEWSRPQANQFLSAALTYIESR